MIIFISIFFILNIIFFTSKLKIKIRNCQKDKFNSNVRFDINIGIYVFGILKIFGFSLNENCIKLLYFKIPYKKLNLKKMNMKNTNFKNLKKSVQKLDFKIEKLDFSLNIGCEENGVVTFFTFAISSVLGILCGKFGNLDKCYYKINPIYNVNLLEFKIESIFSIKTISIIKFIINYKKIKEKENFHFNLRKLISV